ncbi:alpha/beta hydrolase [Gordonia sp. TBRC 11910]|uniref:Alpha/beta hydrolase n=2 Tax=Gordonia asplenii TaxID=2725283 RepID=A0A848L5Q1_9ACTN|nr:alpha/beta hydrolase [Gordonia asplenii]
MDVRNYDGPVPAKAGTLINHVPLDARLSVPAAGRSYRMQYSTPNQHGQMATSTAVVFLPKGTAPAGGWPVIAWAHGTVGLGDDCTPSAQPRSQRDSDYLSHWLRQGYAVVGTDYVGLGTPGLMSYLNGRSEAHSIVDSVNAVHQLGLPLANRWAIVGQSQGAGAALNGARYANELSRGSGLDYRGVVATGTPANIEQIIALGGPTFPPVKLPAGLNTYAAYILAGFIDARPDLHPEQVLTPYGRQIVEQARHLCYPEMSDLMDGKRLTSLFAKPITAIPGARQALADYMGTPYSGYDRPIFLGQGLRDIDVPAPSALSLYAQMKADNQPVELHVYPSQDHSGTVYASMADSTPFLARILR